MELVTPRSRREEREIWFGSIKNEILLIDSGSLVKDGDEIRRLRLFGLWFDLCGNVSCVFW